MNENNEYKPWDMDYKTFRLIWFKGYRYGFAKGGEAVRARDDVEKDAESRSQTDHTGYKKYDEVSSEDLS